MGATWFFPQYIHDGAYTTPGNSGLGTAAGNLIVSGIDATGGMVQTATTGTAFAAPLQVTATTPAPAYVSGVTVTYTAPGAGASATFPGGNTAVTNSQGIATVTATANGTAGVYLINATATVNTVGVQTVFLLDQSEYRECVGGVRSHQWQ